MTDLTVDFRASVRSKNTIHYHLITDLTPGEIRRRLRGNWLDRYRSARDLRAYHRAERRALSSRRDRIPLPHRSPRKRDMFEPLSHSLTCWAASRWRRRRFHQPLWRDDKTAQRLGLSRYGCYRCGRGAASERDKETP